MKAVIISPDGSQPMVVVDRPRPRLRPTYILVRTIAVAVNPVDAAALDYHMGAPGNLLGYDYAGIIEEVGSEVTRGFKKGDRVAGGMRAADKFEPENGTFAEFICVKASVAMKIPDGMGFEAASTLGVALVTTGRCFYQKFNIPWPDKSERNPGFLFVYGGSSVMGTMVTQFAKLSNYEVVTTSSPRNFELCKKFGADHVFDYNDPESIEKIKAVTGNSLKLAVDCISTDDAAAYCGKVIASGGKYSNILLAKCPRDDVESFTTLGYSFLGEDWEQFGVVNPASKVDFEYSMGFAKLGERLLEEGKIVTHPVQLRAGGLDAIPAAIDDLRAGKISGQKIVVNV